MPRENKKRGRRAETAKRKREDVETVHSPPKRARPSHDEAALDEGADYIPLSGANSTYRDDAPEDVGADQFGRPFYGMLDDDEQEYFKRADDMLEVNQFANAEERSIFVHSLHKEVSGKELKLACSQSCSRVLERLMMLSDPAELKGLFTAFTGNFLHLIQHRFASHCCETLFTRFAPIITEEIETDTPGSGSSSSAEDLFLAVVEELSGNLGFLITDRFASHALRVFLVVLAGQSPDDQATKALLQSKKKEKIDTLQQEHQVPTAKPTTVPTSFTTALRTIINDIVAGLDTGYLRTLSTHPTGNPVLQLLLRLDLTSFGKQRAQQEDSIVHKLLPDNPVVEGTESASFVNGLVYDPIGSRLLETIVEHAPGKLFKNLYKGLLKERLPSLARNEIAGYVVCRVLERLSPGDLAETQQELLPLISTLAERGRTNVIKTLAERCAIRKLDTGELARSIDAAYADESGSFSIIKALELPKELYEEGSHSNTGLSLNKTTTPRQNATAALLQSMLRIPGALSELVLESLKTLPAACVQYLAVTPALSPTLQIAVTTPTSTLIFRRKMVTRLYGTMGQLAVSASGSYVVDAIERGSQKGLAFVRERVAEELAENEEELRTSVPGRKVWRNWRMDLYQRNRGEWVHSTQEQVGNDGFQSLPGLLGEVDEGKPSKGAKTGARQAQSGAIEQEGTRTAHGHGHQSTADVASNRKTGKAQPGMATGKTALQLAREKYAKKNERGSRQ